jgi:hypothetical protein
MTAITPFPELTKAAWLRSKDTKGRLKSCIETMTALLTSSQLHQAPTEEDVDEEEVAESEEIMEEPEVEASSEGNESTAAAAAETSAMPMISSE